MAPLSYDSMYPRQGDWTTDDLYALPEDGVRRELVDGVMIRMAGCGRVHQKIAMRLGTALDDCCPPDLDVVQAVDVKNSRCPDLLVVSANTIDGNPSHYKYSDVVLAVEIVSPSTQSQDRFAKPIQYAQAGISYYWRIDLEPRIVVNTFTRDDTLGGYVLDYEFTSRINLEKPWAIKIPFNQFVPRAR
ncbi:MAG: Uma2 family endonuclease [Stackebrandtia sp.]